MKKNEMQILVLKISQVTSFLIGVFLTTYNLFSFTVAKHGYYFKDDNQTWLAMGVSFLTIAYVIKNWNKL